jgi:hypothetical protein
MESGVLGKVAEVRDRVTLRDSGACWREQLSFHLQRQMACLSGVYLFSLTTRVLLTAAAKSVNCGFH